MLLAKGMGSGPRILLLIVQSFARQVWGRQ